MVVVEDTNQKLQQHIVVLSSSQSEQIERGLRRSDGITRQLAAAHADGIAIYGHWYRIPTPLARLEMLISTCFLIRILRVSWFNLQMIREEVGIS